MYICVSAMYFSRVPGQKAFCPRGETATRADLQDLESRVARKAEKEAVDASLAAKVREADRAARRAAWMSCVVCRGHSWRGVMVSVRAVAMLWPHGAATQPPCHPIHPTHEE